MAKNKSGKPVKKNKKTNHVSPAVARLARSLASLKGKGRTLVTFHSLGDVDAAASALALQTVLKARGVDAHVRCVDSLNSQARRVLSFYGCAAPQTLVGIDASAIVLVDVSNADLLAEWGPAISGFNGPLFVIDHHYHNKHVKTAQGCALVEPHATSTAEIIMQIARALNCPLPPKTASLLLCAVLADTAFFKSADNATLAAAFALVALGADFGECAALCRAKRDASEALAIIKCVGGARIEKLGAKGAVLAAFGKAHSHELACAAALVDLGCDYAFVANEREGRISAAKSDCATGSVGKIMEAAGRGFGASGSGGGHEKVGGAKGESSRVNAALEECLALVRKLA
ncbi:MAG: DHH family phosphoesterase [Candidatus Micrarchaeota archaeon]